jgi:hypothetical protein
MAGLAAATAAVGVYAQRQTAKAQARNIGIQQEHEREEAVEAATEELGQRIRANREQRARARVAAGESGVGGASFAASLNQSLQDQDETVALAAKNVAFAQRGIDDRANTALSQIRSPSALEAGLTIASAGAQGYSTGLSIKARTTVPDTPLPEIGSAPTATSTRNVLPVPGTAAA